MGQSDNFVTFDNEVPGLAAFGFAYRGDGLFVVELIYGSGQSSGILAIEIGEYKGEITHRLQAGHYTPHITRPSAYILALA